MRTAIKSVAKFGFCPESSWEYRGPWKKRPPWSAYRDSIDQRKIVGYYRIGSEGEVRMHDVKLAIASGYAVTFGTDVSMAFVAGDAPGDGVWRKPAGEPIAGGHAMAAVEYDERGVAGPNSWGEGWGDKGWFCIGWDYIAWDRTRDLWVIDVAA